jgi:hypothetical protein
MKRHLLSLVLAVGLATGGAASAQQGGVRLVAQPALGPNLAAFPRLAAADGPSKRINQALTKADAMVRDAAEGCHEDALAAKDPDGGWQRSVVVAMRGPGYLTLVASDSWFCGGAYPDTLSFALDYDLKTGSPLNLARLLPKALVHTTSLDNAGDGIQLGVVASPALTALYLELAKPDSDCAQSLEQEDLHFMLWPDAAADGVGMKPSGLAHAIEACGPEVTIPEARLRRLGADAGLVDAIAAGHKAGLFDRAP